MSSVPCSAAALPDPAVFPNGRSLVRLNLGCGDQPLSGYDNIDRKHGEEVFPISRRSGDDIPLPIADESVDEIRASHVLEHFSHREIHEVLRHWVAKLKPGGLLKVAVPNFLWVAQNYLAGNPINVQGYVMGGHVDGNDHHGCIFDEEELTTALRDAGLWDIRPWKSEIQDCAALPVSLNLQGRKKGPLPKLKIACATSVPRLGFMDHFHCAFNSLVPLGILPERFMGAFWGQCLERVMESQLDADWILVTDYDSVYSKETVEHLIRLAAEHPEADAIAPVEIRRAGETMLATVRGENGKLVPQVDFDELKQELMRVATAHFGLTLIRVEALKKLEHPWFLGVPDADGKWGEGRTDDDTYFWKKWNAAGNTVFLAPHCVIAHGQFMLTWPDKMMRPVFQHPSEFWEQGPPDNVWR